jgi:hypothetical protein
MLRRRRADFLPDLLSGPWVLFGIFLLAAVYWASLRMGRHDKSELLIGTTVPTYALLLAFLIVIGYAGVG